MILNVILGSLTLVSLGLLIWQWVGARRFPLHSRVEQGGFEPAVTLFKPLKGCDESTEECLRSWLVQDYAGPMQVLFAVAAADDPVCGVVRKLIAEHPGRDVDLVVCTSLAGMNAKVSKLAELERRARHDVWVISDADVRVSPDLLKNVIAPLRDPRVGLVNCFYRLANPGTWAMQIEAIAINADFWSQVLQSRALKPLDFALGAVMATRRVQLEEIGGFAAMQDCLADDYQLGHRIAGKGHGIELCPVVVECWDPPKDARAVWKHQLRWARTIRVSQPLPYFFSIVSNATLWPLLWVMHEWGDFGVETSEAPGALAEQFTLVIPVAMVVALICCVVRIVAAHDLQRRLTRSRRHREFIWLVPIKDLLQSAVWLGAFLGNGIEWRGQRYGLRRDGTMVRRD